MVRFVLLLVLALLTVAEVAAVVALVNWLGPFLALVVLGLDILVGLMVMRSAIRGPVKDRGVRLAAGAFIALPGLVLDLVGVALLVPGVREWLRSSVTRGTESALRRSGISVVTVTATGDVIPGTVIVDEARDSSGPPSADASTPGNPQSGGYRPGGSAQQPHVIRGDIVSGEIVAGDPADLREPHDRAE